MATIARATRSTIDTLRYPANFPGHAAHGCDGCLGKKGDCTAATRVTVLHVDYVLSDGRTGSVELAPTASDADVAAAISAQLTAATADPLIGRVIV